MKKIIVIFSICLAFVTVANAQTSSLQPIKPDTIKTLNDLSAYLKQHHVVSLSTGLKADSPVFTYRGIHKNPFVQNNNLTFITTEPVAENMPVAKLSSADKMPVAKLGDTDNTHFTMMVKPLDSVKQQPKPVTP